MAAPGENMRVNADRLWDSLMDMAKIGPGIAGGNNRQTLTDSDAEGRRLFQTWCEGAGLSMGVDTMGNMFMTRPGSDPDALPVYVGSHLDTQPTGGKYDGVLGVLAGLEVVRTLNAAGVRTRAPIEVAVWTNEEGSRFVPVMMGSGVFAGAFTLEHALAQRDAQGISVGEALAAIGYAGSPGATPDVGAYFEAHIEQGPVLEANNCVIGVVQGALGQRWYDVVVQGMEAHAGPTPMALRRDALLAASEIVAEVNRIALERAPHARGTVGQLEVFPNSRNVIPGKVSMSVDLRAGDDTVLLDMDADLRRTCARIARERSLAIEVQQVVYFPPQPFTSGLVEGIRSGAANLGYSAMDVVSGAGHDAVYLARLAPTAMIFVPCTNGISHNEIEDAQPGHLEAGCNVLLQAMLLRAGVAA